MADNWNEQDLQALFHKHLPVKQMPQDFAEQLKKQVLAEVAATLGTNPVKSVATEEASDIPVVPVSERLLQPKAPRSVATSTPGGWVDWLRANFRFTPSFATAGAMLLVLFAFIVWSDRLTPNTGRGGQIDTLPSPTVVNSVAAGITVTPTPAVEEPTVLPSSVEESVDVVATDTLVPNTPATANEAGANETPTDVVTVITVVPTGEAEEPQVEDEPSGAEPELTDTATSTRLPVTPTPVDWETPQENATATRTPGLTPSATSATPSVLTITATPNRLTATATPVTPTQEPAGRNGTATSTPDRPTIVATPIPLGLTNVVTLTATKLPTTGPIVAATMIPFEPTDVPSPVPTATPVPATATPIVFAPWKSPTPTLTSTPTATDVPLPTATSTNTALPTATNTLLPTATPTATSTNTALPTATDTPLPTATPTATSTNTALPTATNTLLPTATPTNTPLPTATDTPLPTATPTATNTPFINHSPVVLQTPVVVIEDSLNTLNLFSFVKDEDGQPLRITDMVGASHGEALWTVGTDIVIYKPALNYSGPDSIGFAVTDGFVTVNVSLLITVLPINDTPEIRSQAPLFATEATEYSSVIDATDQDNAPADLRFRITEGPFWLHIEEVGGRLYGTPTGSDVGGPFVVRIEVSDLAGGVTSKEFMIIVAPNPPMDSPTVTTTQAVIAASPLSTETQIISGTIDGN